MRYYPVFLDVRERPCVVVGGGRVAERKAIALFESKGIEKRAAQVRSLLEG